jgi:hypothetical protein
MTIVFANNGNGKSTFTSILRSLQTGNNNILIGKKTLGSTGAKKIEIDFEDGGEAVVAKFESKKWQESTFNVNKTLQSTQKDLTTAQDEIRRIKYENEILKDPAVVRIYDVSAAKATDALVARLSESSLGFQFDEENGSIKATKQFDNNAEAWWVFDKTIDVLLELNLRVAPHLYDPNRSVVYGSTNLLEKIRYSNKQYSPQEDTDKIKLYQEKALRLLEMNIRKTAVK